MVQIYMERIIFYTLLCVNHNNKREYKQSTLFELKTLSAYALFPNILTVAIQAFS